jgi:glycerate kinase
MDRGASKLGLQTAILPMADGGEGIVEVFGGVNRESEVTGPLGKKVNAGWRIEEGRAVIELASASGLTLVDGAAHNDPMKASSVGTGELIAAAIEAGATHIIVGAGGSSCTDGGLGAVDALRSYAPLDGTRGVEVLVASDVQTPFLDAAKIFGAQKGATPVQITELTHVLEALAKQYQKEFGVDVTAISGSGAAGGFAGGMAALGATIVNGFNLVAQEMNLDDFLSKCDFLLTGEGSFDQSSFEGKVVGSLLARSKKMGIPCAVIAGRVADNAKGDFESMSLVDMFGPSRAMNDAARSVENATYTLLKRYLSNESTIDRGE